MTDVINDEKAVVDLDAARPRPALSDATNDELVTLPSLILTLMQSMNSTGYTGSSGRDCRNHMPGRASPRSAEDSR